ncbi:MAG: ATP-binding protein [Bacilli bacterium]|nr:ATP-binding protein [Bacilli bacterium]
MKRKYLEQLIEWNIDKQRKPLMIWGARQVGKSYLVEELFAKVYYKNRYLKIDLSDDNEFSLFAEQNSNLDKVLEYISLHYHFTPDNNHLLFFDEVQECPSILKMMKHFCEKRRDIPVIVSGSLVRTRIHRDGKKTNKKFLFPVGKINQLYVFPMTFDEYLLNFDENKYNYVKSHFESKEAIDPIIHKELIDDFRTYMFVGGMPESVDTFLNYKDDKIKALKMVSKKIREIYDDYLDDMGLYQTSTKSIIRSRLIYGNIYKQLNKENKNYKISQVVEGAKNRDAINPFFWLNSSNVILESFLLKEKVTSPLIRNEDSLFRVYLSDVGMFTHQSGLSFEKFLIDKDNALSGIFYENYVATELVARRRELFYWKGKRNSELEFVIDINGEIVPIDVEKGKDRLESLNEFRTHNKTGLAIKVSSNQYGYNESKKLLTLPFYYFSFYLDSLN